MPSARSVTYPPQRRLARFPSRPCGTESRREIADLRGSRRAALASSGPPAPVRAATLGIVFGPGQSDLVKPIPGFLRGIIAAKERKEHERGESLAGGYWYSSSARGNSAALLCASWCSLAAGFSTFRGAVRASPTWSHLVKADGAGLFWGRAGSNHRPARGDARPTGKREAVGRRSGDGTWTGKFLAAW